MKQDYIKNWNHAVRWRQTKNVRMTRQAVSLAEINKWVVCLPSSTLKNKKPQTSLSTYNTFITPVTLLYWQEKRKKKRQKTVMITCLTSYGPAVCLSLFCWPRMLDMWQTAWQLYVPPSLFWIATAWNWFSHKVNTVINELSYGNACYPSASSEK